MTCSEGTMSTVVPALCNRECLCATGYTSNEALQNCEAYPKVVRCLTAYFQFGEFRPGQLETLMAVLHGRDVFVRLPTNFKLNERKEKLFSMKYTFLKGGLKRKHFCEYPCNTHLL